MNIDGILQIAISIAHEAGAIVRAGFPSTALAHIGFKGAVNPVTETDTAAEQLIIARLRAAFPEHRILAEEGGFVARGSAEARTTVPAWGRGSTRTCAKRRSAARTTDASSFREASFW